MISLVKDYLLNNKIKDKTILVALSGGPDSIFLLNTLNILKKDFNLSIEAAYINHGIRNSYENDLDDNLVTKACSDRNIKLYKKIYEAGVLEQIAKDKGSSIEAVARESRYDFFEKNIDVNSLVALGHNRDDQFETQIMRFFQGSSLNGLIGIKDRRANIIRPLISISKTNILKYLNENNIPYNIDKTNSESDYLRNRVRNKLIPLVSEIFPGYESALKKLESDFNEYNDLLNSNYPELKWSIKDNSHFCNYESFMSYPLFKRKEEIYKIFNNTYVGEIKDFRLPNRFLLPLSRNDYKNGTVILHGYGFRLYRYGDKLIWESDSEKEYFFKLNIKQTGVYKNSNFSFSISNNVRGVFVSGLTLPFSIRSLVNGGSEKKILKKKGLDYNYNKLILIVEKYNELYAIIYKNKVIYNKSDSSEGIYIDY